MGWLSSEEPSDQASGQRRLIAWRNAQRPHHHFQFVVAQWHDAEL